MDDQKMKQTIQIFLLIWFTIASLIVFIPAGYLLLHPAATGLRDVYKIVVDDILAELVKAILASLLAYAFVRGAERFVELRWPRRS